MWVLAEFGFHVVRVMELVAATGPAADRPHSAGADAPQRRYCSG